MEARKAEGTGFQSDVGKDTSEMEPDIISEIQSEPVSNLEDTSEVLSELPSESTPETVSGVQSRHLVVWLSEYFQPDLPASLPEGCLMEEILGTNCRRSERFHLRFPIQNKSRRN